MRISYVNGEFLPHEEAKISIDDRGLLFADSIYEVILVYNGRLIDANEHLNRLERSANAIQMIVSKKRDDILQVLHSIVQKNNLINGYLYLQVTFGIAEREHLSPIGIKESIIVTAKNLEIRDKPKTIKVITQSDIRWKRCDIKSTSLLPAAIMMRLAREKGADDVIFVNNHSPTESTCANLFIVQDNVLITHPRDQKILHGTVRNRVIAIAKENKIQVKEKPMILNDLYSADEVFLTSSTMLIRSVTKVDGKTIGNGSIGQTTNRLYALYIDWMNKSN